MYQNKDKGCGNRDIWLRLYVSKQIRVWYTRDGWLRLVCIKTNKGVVSEMDD